MNRYYLPIIAILSALAIGCGEAAADADSLVTVRVESPIPFHIDIPSEFRISEDRRSRAFSFIYDTDPDRDDVGVTVRVSVIERLKGEESMLDKSWVLVSSPTEIDGPYSLDLSEAAGSRFVWHEDPRFGIPRIDGVGIIVETGNTTITMKCVSFGEAADVEDLQRIADSFRFGTDENADEADTLVRIRPSSAKVALDDGNEWILDDYAAAVDKAKTTGKPIFIDFTGYTVTNSRWMESNVFTHSDVRQLMDQYVLVRLYTDRREASNQRNQQMQIDRFRTIDLPYYVVLTPDDEFVAEAHFTRDVEEFADFLQQGIDAVVEGEAAP